MSGVHPDIGPELRQLAQAILDRIDPAVRLAARAAGSGDGPGRCQQVWCPVCALAALATGEQHPLLSIVAQHSASLLAVIRTLVDSVEPPPTPGPPPPGPGQPPPPDEPPPPPPGRYQHIPITVEE